MSLSAAEQRYLNNAVFIGASKLIFDELVAQGTPLPELGNIAKTTSGGTPNRGIQSYYGGNIPWIKSGELNDSVITDVAENITPEGLNSSSAKIFPKGTLLIALYGATVGKTGILGLDAASNQAVCAIFPKPECVDKRYLYWFFRHKRTDFLAKSFGGAQPNISQKLLRATLVPLPDKSIQVAICDFFESVEQRKEDLSTDLLELPGDLSGIRRIVARIEALAGKVEEARRLREEATDELEQFVASVERGLWPEESLKNAQTLQEVTTHLARGKQSKQGESEHFLIKTRHVQMDDYVESDMTLAPHIAKKIKPDDFVQFGDILIACSARGSLGRVARFDVEDQVASTDTHVAIARPNQDIIIGDYLYAYLKGAQGQYQLRSRERGDWRKKKTSFRLAELNLRDLRNVPVPVPSFKEQQRIISYLGHFQSKAEAIRRQQAATQCELDALLPAILDKAFKGELQRTKLVRYAGKNCFK